MSSIIKKIILTAVISAMTVGAGAASPDHDRRLTGVVTCDLISNQDLQVEYAAYIGQGEMRVIENGDIVYRKDIFLLKGTRCSVYSGKCFTVINAPTRLGNEFKISVDPDGEDYNATDFFSLRIVDGTKFEIRDSGEHHSRLHMSVGYQGAPAPLNERGIEEMICNGDLFSNDHHKK